MQKMTPSDFFFSSSLATAEDEEEKKDKEEITFSSSNVSYTSHVCKSSCSLVNCYKLSSREIKWCSESLN